MSTELTPREHDDMRDLLVAGTQRVRPARSRSVQISTGVAVILVAAAVGGVATAALNTGRPDGSPVGGDPTPAVTTDPTPTVTSDVWPTVINAPSPPPLPATGTHITLQPVPSLDEQLVIGTSNWLDEHGIDVASAQGYESWSVHWIEAWTADLKDGSGQCILMRKDPSGSGGWSEIVCDANGVGAWVDREVDGTVLRFTIAGDVMDVYSVPR